MPAISSRARGLGLGLMALVALAGAGALLVVGPVQHTGTAAVETTGTDADEPETTEAKPEETARVLGKVLVRTTETPELGEVANLLQDTTTTAPATTAPPSTAPPTTAPPTTAAPATTAPPTTAPAPGPVPMIDPNWRLAGCVVAVEGDAPGLWSALSTISSASGIQFQAGGNAPVRWKVVVTEPGGGAAGLTESWGDPVTESEVLIAERALGDGTLLHELAHAMGLHHGDGVMSASRSGSATTQLSASQLAALAGTGARTGCR